MTAIDQRRELVGRNAYARHRRVVPSAVAKAEESGRIAAAVRRDQAGRFVGIDWRLADRLWVQNTDFDQAMRSVASQAAPAAHTSAPGDRGAELAGLARAVGLARVDFLEQAEASGYIAGTPISASELHDLVDIFIDELATRLEAAVGPRHGDAVRKLLEERPDAAFGSFDEALSFARAAVPGRNGAA